MNRIVKFRGKDIETGEWRYGDLLQHENGDVNIMVHEAGCWHRPYAVDPETVGQKVNWSEDEYGKYLFEGDILLHTYHDNRREVYILTWNPDQVAFGFATDEKDSWPQPINYLDGSCLDLEVIGNRHDNPELLTKKEADR